MRRKTDIVRILFCGALLLPVTALGCGEKPDEMAAPEAAEVQGIDPDDLPASLSEKGRRPAETFCDGPYSTASSC